MSNSPETAKFTPFITPVAPNGKRYCVGLFAEIIPGAARHSDYVYPALLREESDGSWSEIDWRQPLYKDQQEDIDPALMMTMIVRDFNLTLEKEMSASGNHPDDLNGDGLVDWIEKVARFHSAKYLSFVNGSLVFTQ